MDRLPNEQLDKMMELSTDNPEVAGSYIFIKALSDLTCCIETMRIKKDLKSHALAELTAHIGMATYALLVPLLTSTCHLLKQNDNLTAQIATLTARIARLEGAENAN